MAAEQCCSNSDMRFLKLDLETKFLHIIKCRAPFLFLRSILGGDVSRPPSYGVYFTARVFDFNNRTNCFTAKLLAHGYFIINFGKYFLNSIADPQNRLFNTLMV